MDAEDRYTDDADETEKNESMLLTQHDSRINIFLATEMPSGIFATKNKIRLNPFDPRHPCIYPPLKLKYEINKSLA